MKITKKIIALLLAMALAFCFVACGEPEPTECTSHVDKNGDGICDTEGCGAPVEKKPPQAYVPTPVNPAQAAAYVGAIWGAVENAKTVTVSIDMTSASGVGDSIDESGKVVEEAYGDAMSVHFDITLAKTQEAVNLKVVGTADVDGDIQAMEAYIVDGVGYSRNKEDTEWGEWYVAPVEIPEEITSTVGQIMAVISSYLPEDFEITEDMIAEAKAAIAGAVSALMTVNEDGSFGAKLDAKPAVDAVLGFVAAIDIEDTMAEFINSVLALVDPEMTVEAILDGVGTYGSLTVGEIYTAVNDAVNEKTGMTIQQLKDAVLAEEQITSLLVAYGVVTEQMLADIKAMDIDTMMADYMEMTMDDVVYMVMMSMSDPEASPANDGDAGDTVDTTGMLAAMAAELKTMLTDTTVGVAAGEGFDVFLDVIKTVDVDALYAYVNVKLGADLSFGKIEFGEKIDISLTGPMTVYDEENETVIECKAEQYVQMEVVVAITSISSSETVIEAPEVVEA